MSIVTPMLVAAPNLPPYPPDWDDVQAPEDDVAVPVKAPAPPVSATREERRRKQRIEWHNRKRQVYSLACDLRDGLRAILGGKCNKCGADEDLQFDHPHGRDWTPATKNLLARMRRYWADYRCGKLQLLCGHCNGSAGAKKGNRMRKKKRS